MVCEGGWGGYILKRKTERDGKRKIIKKIIKKKCKFKKILMEII